MACGPARAEDDLRELLERLGPAPAVAAGRVEVAAVVTRDAHGPALVVTLRPREGAQLVADPGVSLTGHPVPGLAWSPPAVLAVPDTDYLPSPATIRLPFTGSASTVSATLDYGWCQATARQCLFGTTEVTAALP